MLGFDRTGGRIGYGAGYYDRFLEKYPDLRKIGLAFSCQEIEKLPLDNTDVLMDTIITEEGIVYKEG
jgi:5-formyltetrahydrofolate cyclo-ligase